MSKLMKVLVVFALIMLCAKTICAQELDVTEIAPSIMVEQSVYLHTVPPATPTPTCTVPPATPTPCEKESYGNIQDKNPITGDPFDGSFEVNYVIVLCIFIMLISITVLFLTENNVSKRLE
jgi:hypothetical protein